MNTLSKQNREEIELIAVRAEEWIERLKGRASDSDCTKFLAWLKQSPLHIREILLATAWDKALKQVLSSHHSLHFPIDSDTPLQRETDDADRAKGWLQRMDQPSNPHDGAEYVAWLEESSLHVREMLFLVSAGPEPDAALDSGHVKDLEAPMLHRTTAAMPGIHALGRISDTAGLTIMPPFEQSRARIRWSWWVGFCAAPLLAIAAVLIWPRLADQRWQASTASGEQRSAVAPQGSILDLKRLFKRSEVERQFSTAVGELRSVALPDGSILHMNAQSDVRVLFSDAARDAYLLEGQALFKVKRDAKRPFRVHADSAVVQAVGTQFDVHRLRDHIDVAVIEGQVAISATDGNANEQPSAQADLGAGKAVRISADGTISPPADIAVADVLAWQNRRVVFHNETLVEIAAEFNRYNKAPQLRIEDPALQLKRYSGVFEASDVESFVGYLATDPRLAFDRSIEGDITIRVRSSYALNP